MIKRVTNKSQISKRKTKDQMIKELINKGFGGKNIYYLYNYKYSLVKEDYDKLINADINDYRYEHYRTDYTGNYRSYCNKCKNICCKLNNDYTIIVDKTINFNYPVYTDFNNNKYYIDPDKKIMCYKCENKYKQSLYFKEKEKKEEKENLSLL